MNTKTIGFTIIISLIVICLLIYSPLTQANKPSVNLGYEMAFEESEQYKPKGLYGGTRVRFALWFLKHAEPVEVYGNVIGVAEKKLILNTDETQIRINLPPDWTVNNEVVTREELFANGYLSEVEGITVKALEADLIDREGLHIYLLVGYEIIDQTGVHATANLPVNIET